MTGEQSQNYPLSINVFASCVDPEVSPPSIREGGFPFFGEHPYFSQSPGQYGALNINPAVVTHIDIENQKIDFINAEVQRGRVEGVVDVMATKQEGTGIYVQALLLRATGSMLKDHRLYINFNIAGGGAALAPRAKQIRVLNDEGNPIAENLPTSVLVIFLAKHLSHIRAHFFREPLHADLIPEITLHLITHSLCLWHHQQDTLANEVGDFKNPDRAFIAVERSALLGLAGQALVNWYDVILKGLEIPDAIFRNRFRGIHRWDKSDALGIERR